MRYSVLLTLLSLSLFAEGSNELLKPSKKELLQKKRDEVEIRGDFLKNSWWGGVNLEWSYNSIHTNGKDDDFPNFTATISQDIFRSGGIFYQIDSGKVFKSLNLAKLDKEERKLLFSIFQIVLQIRKLDIKIAQQQLRIRNKEIIIKNQKDSYTHGLIDISQLDESIIELNSLKNGKEGLLQAKTDLIANLENLTDRDYQDIEVPQFPIISLDEYLNRNIDIKIQKENIRKLEIDKKLTYSKYLPRVSLYGAYQYDTRDPSPERHDATSYGVKVSMPISFNMGDVFEGAKVAYLRSQSELRDIEDEQKLKYRKVISQLESIKRKMSNTKELIKSYQSIYEITSAYSKNNLKSEDDVKIIKNRVEISSLDLEIYKIEQELAKLELYRDIVE